IDVDTVTSRHTEPTRFDGSATADKIVEDGASRADNLHRDFDLAFPDDEDGRKADARIGRLVGRAHDKYCADPGTVEHPTNRAVTVRRDWAPPPRGRPAVTTEAGAEVCPADVTAARVAAAGAGATDAVWTSTAAHRCPAGGRRSSDRTR